MENFHIMIPALFNLFGFGQTIYLDSKVDLYYSEKQKEVILQKFHQSLDEKPICSFNYVEINGKKVYFTEQVKVGEKYSSNFDDMQKVAQNVTLNNIQSACKD